MFLNIFVTSINEIHERLHSTHYLSDWAEFKRHFLHQFDCAILFSSFLTIQKGIEQMQQILDPFLIRQKGVIFNKYVVLSECLNICLLNYKWS